MKLTCSRCNDRPRASVKSHRCLPCERDYRLERRTERRAANRRWWAKMKKQRAQDREDRIQWWIRQSPDSMNAIKETYKLRQCDMPREYDIAMRRLERQRRQVQLEHLNTLPPKLARAAIRWQKANLAGSRPEDTVREREWA